RTWVSVKGELYKEPGASKAGHKMLIVDAGRDEPLAGSARRAKLQLDPDGGPPEGRPPAGVAALFGFSRGQVSYDSDALRRGIFWHYLLEGLQGRAANERGEVRLDALARYVRSEV